MSDSEAARAQALVGQTLGEAYRLDALIGRGAMGAVYRATTEAGAVVAVKTLSAEVMGPQTTQRFLRESELVRGLAHPHVVRTLGSGTDRATGLLFLVMPLLQGRDLDQILETLGALPPETAVRMALQAARGLSAAHRIGIVHRDVKPGNLFLDEEPGGELVVRVCDFGIAKRVGGESELTATGNPLGTPDYVSPEQLKNSKHVDERTDVWSLGATLYQMLGGAAPYSQYDTVFDVITAILSEDPPSLQDRAPWVEPSLALVVHKALQRDPNQRWATLEDMADALRPFAGGDELLDAARVVPVNVDTKRRTAGRADLSQAAAQTSLPPPPLATADELGLIGQKLDGRFLVKRLLGKGGMGSVYEVEADGGERLAAKVVSSGAQGASPATLRRFAREAKASSAVSSLNVARTVDAGCDDRLGFPYIVMELLHGVDLSTLMKREGAVSPEVAVRLAVQAARGIAAAHSRGVVHRDIKPANLFLQEAAQSSEVVVKVCDFGVAKHISGMGLSSAAGRYSLTGSGGVLGSPLYMSPEQARSAKHVDERTDVWSLSVVLWELLAGQRLWGGQRSLGELLVAICTEPIPRLETVAPWVPRELARAAQQGLERDLGQRTPTARALIESLEPFAGSSARVVMSQLVGLSEAQRKQLTLERVSADSARGAIADAKTPGNRPPIGSLSVVGVGGPARATTRRGSSKSALVGVALLSAAVAGGAAYFLARGPGTPATATPTAPFVTAHVAVVPADAQVSTKQGALSVVDGTTTLQGRAGETLQVTVRRDGSSKTFAVSLGSDGIASPSRLVLSP